MRVASWVIRERESKTVIIETFDKRNVERLDTEKYEAVPIEEYLASLNKNSSRCD